MRLKDRVRKHYFSKGLTYFEKVILYVQEWHPRDIKIQNEEYVLSLVCIRNEHDDPNSQSPVLEFDDCEIHYSLNREPIDCINVYRY